MYSFKELRKAVKLNIDGKKITIAVLGNCATQFFSLAIEGAAKLAEVNLSVVDIDYNQIDAQLLDVDSETYKCEPNVILLWLATEKLYEEFLDSTIDERSSFADIYIKKIKQYWNCIQRNSTAQVIQFNFTEINDNSLGNYSCKVDTTFVYQMRKLNWLLEEAMHENCNVFPVDIKSIQIRLGQSAFYDSTFYYNAKMSVSTKALPYIAESVVSVIKALNGKIKKCIVLDLDNTLWGGVIGDDGINNIEIGELGRGHAYTNFQRWLKQLKECGIILAVCSKNNEETAKEPFLKHDEMILHLDDFSVFVANWDDKASNIRTIQETLNIGMDSMVFIDDNPFERNLVRELIPDIEVPELPEDPAQYLEFLQNSNLFETASFIGKASDRTKLYQAEFERKRAENSYDTIDEYLQSLEMMGQAKPFEESRFSRIAQLTQRSNQFNLRTIRYTEDDIRKISLNPEYVTLFYTLKDKYGDHGLVGVVILRKMDESTLFIDTWLMSCRVLKRGMEEFVINKIIEVAKDKGFSKIYAEYIATNKNMMVRNIYSQMGFVEYEPEKYVIELKDYITKKTYIQEEK